MFSHVGVPTSGSVESVGPSARGRKREEGREEGPGGVEAGSGSQASKLRERSSGRGEVGHRIITQVDPPRQSTQTFQSNQPCSPDSLSLSEETYAAPTQRPS